MANLQSSTKLRINFVIGEITDLDVEARVHDDNRDAVILQQGDDQVWLPRDDLAEFVRLLTEWSASERK